MCLKLREIRYFFQISQVFTEIRVVPFVERWSFSDFFDTLCNITAIDNKEVCLYDNYITSIPHLNYS